ncbi:amidohydrolase family protein [Adhaeribacter rhizoryzae]|uniref:Amidohydrolase family protein n=1 Tax=Adhaeribacter rhizoryzae TaxID=2607907 RepID=A0A5M6D2C3_9BACT|nr:amidohydrolase family protein [Adhaeribacter rhizoryzae]KAA5541601.1 amidohydrolase family protein [Adhaeribacter rhizoryzae]
MRYCCILIFCLIQFQVNGQGTASVKQGEVVFRNVNVIPMDQERVLANQTVVVKDGKITYVGEAKNAKYGKAATLVEAKGKYLMPGLAEMHAHVPPVDNLEPMKEVLMLFAANGITTIRGMLGHPRHLELRSKINSGEILGPHFYTTGPSFSGQSVKTPEQATSMVRQQKAAGYNYLKLHPGLTLETFDAMAQTAKEVNIPFVGHVSFDVGIWRAINAGYSSIDHLDGFIEGLVPGIDSMKQEQVGLFGMFVADKVDTTRITKLMQGLKAKNIWVVPTQALAERWFAPVTVEQFSKAPEMVYMAPEVRRNWANSKKSLQANPQYNAAKMKAYIQLRRKLILACQRNGVGLLLGCDAPQIFNVPGFSTHQELKYLVDAGLTPYQALQTGTVNVAKYLNQTGNAGIIKVGAVSDLILLAGNPLQDITQTRRIEGVMLGNRWLPKTYLQQQLQKLKKG